MTDQELFDNLFAKWAADTKDNAAQFLNSQFELCESPIERRLMIALAFTQPRMQGGYDMPLLAGGQLFIWPQHTVGRYRIDLAVRLHSLPSLKIAVECDGHDFHERTKQQAARDKARDRFLTLKGWQVLRFTGSEIWHDPVGCAEQVVTLMDAHQERVWKDEDKIHDAMNA